MTEEGRYIRQVKFDNIFMEEFELLFYMRGMTYDDVENLTSYERKRFHSMLVEHLKKHPPLFG